MISHITIKIDKNLKSKFKAQCALANIQMQVLINKFIEKYMDNADKQK